MIERRGLGKGLSALIPMREQLVVDETKREEVVFINVNKIQPNPYQPRENFDQEGIEDLTASVKEKGVIQPVLVRRIANDIYELIAGERRLRAVKALNLEEIPAIIRNIKDEESLEIALIENIQRQELNPMEEACAYRHLIEKFSYTQEKIAQAVGKARASVTNTLRLLKLPREIQEMLRKGAISFAHGKALLELDDNQRQLALARQAASKGLTVAELNGLMLAAATAKKRLAKADKTSAQAKALEDELQQVLGTRVRITQGAKRGNITIEFYSNEDLERVYRIIKR